VFVSIALFSLVPLDNAQVTGPRHGVP